MWFALMTFAQAADWTPSPAFEAGARALAARHDSSCEAVEALTTDPVALLRELVDHAAAPPWVPMRAADCLASRHAEAAKVDILAWIADPERKGLAWVALDRLDVMPEPIAIELAAAAAVAPEPDRSLRRIAKSERTAVRAAAGLP